MPSKNEDDLARISAESKAHVLAGRASLEASADHIVQSRNAIVRSLELLSRKFTRLYD